MKTKITDTMDKDDCNIVTDFKTRTPYDSYRPVDYVLYKPLQNLRTILDEKLEKLFRGEIDSGNGNVFDNLIDEISSQAITDSDKQYTEHTDMIERQNSRRLADRHNFEVRLTSLNEELARKEATLNEYYRKAQKTNKKNKGESKNA